MLKSFARYYKPHWKLFVLDMVCALIAASCDLMYPVISRNIINTYIPDKNLQLIFSWCAALLVIYIIQTIMQYIMQYQGHVVGVRMQADMRRDVFTHLQKLPFSYFDEHKTGVIMSRIVNDLMDISEFAHHGPEDLFISAVFAFLFFNSVFYYLFFYSFFSVLVCRLFGFRVHDYYKTVFQNCKTF